MESDDVDLSRDKAGWLGQYLDNIIYQEWARTSADVERPPIQIPGKVNLGKYAPPVIYYVASGTLYREREREILLFVWRVNTKERHGKRNDSCQFS